jgi:methylenetetrahydrofolate reductase (NADPH)
LKRVVDMGLHKKCYILAGVTPMKNVGMDVPKALIKKLNGAGVLPRPKV